MRRRLSLMLLATLLLFGAVIVRLTQLQVVSSDRFEAIGNSQRVRHVALSAERGAIFDRYGKDLAESVPQKTIWADPRSVQDPYLTAAALSPLLNQDLAVVEAKLRQQKSFVYLARTVPDEVAEAVKALKLKGVAMYDESRRFLPGDDLLRPVVGQVGTDNDGLSGLELQYEKQLKGKPGRMVVEQTPSGRDIPGGLRRETSPKPGDDLVLTIDRDLQFKVEEALTRQIENTNARGGIAAVMDTKTGEVLALVNLSVRNGGRGSPVEPAPSNSALTNVYEPGSVSKLITISAALESGTVEPATRFTIRDSIRVADATFNEAEPHPVMNWSTTDIVAASSNVGTITIGQKVGKEKLDQYQRAFGYGTSTGLQFPGESRGLVLDPKKYSGTSLATTAIGQGVSVTAMQMIAAYNTIANGGVYIAPKLVGGVVDSGGRLRPTAPSNARQVVSPETAAQMNLMLREVVRVGTATAAQIQGYGVAGKTGTARKPRSNGPGYEEGAYISSFAGFVPAEDPRLTAMVILDQPTPIFGGLVAAPVFSDISRYAIQKYGIAPVAAGTERFGVPFASPSASAAANAADAKPAATPTGEPITEKANKVTTSGPSTTSPRTRPRSTAGAASGKQ